MMFTVASDTSYTAVFSINNLANNTVFIWNCQAFDSNDNSSFASQNYTLSVIYSPIPEVQLNIPQDGATEASTTINFNCSASDDEDIYSLNLYTNRTGSFTFEQMHLFTGNSDTDVSWQFSQNDFSDETGYVWNCKAIDNESNEAFATQNNSFTVNLGKPTVTLDSPNDKSVLPSGNMTLNCSVVDNEDVASVALYTNLSGSFDIEQTASFNGNSDTSVNVVFNLTNIDSGIKFIWNCFAVDNESNSAFAPNNYTVATYTSLSHFYATNVNGDWKNPSNVLGAPDEITADEDLDKGKILSTDTFTGVPTKGTLLAAYLTIAWRAESSTGDDQLDLGYSLSSYDNNNLNLDGSTYDGSTSASNFPTFNIENQSYQITGSVSLSDLSNIRMRIQGDRVGGADKNKAYIDSLYLSIRYSPPPTPLGIAKSPDVVFQNYTVQFYSNWTDDMFLDCFIFSINQSGNFVNSSCISFDDTPGQANYSYFISAIAGTKVEWLFYARDNYGVYNQTPLQSFIVADADDNTPPTISNEQVNPSEAQALSNFNITATITDNIGVQKAYVELTNPNGITTNYTMSNIGGNLYLYMFEGLIGGNYSFRIIAKDGNNNINYSQSRPIFNVTSLILTDKTYYARGETVAITGYGFSSNVDVEIDATDKAGNSVSGFPKTETSNADGNVTTTWVIPSDLSFALGNYTFSGNDSKLSWLYDQVDAQVIIREDWAFKLDENFKAGTLVTTEVFDSDNVTTSIYARNNNDYIIMNFTDNLQFGYEPNVTIFYLEHNDSLDSDLFIDIYSGGVYINVCTFTASSSWVIDSCDITSYITDYTSANHISIKVRSDGTLNKVYFTEIDFGFLFMNYTLGNSLSVTIDVPSLQTNTYDYTDAVNNNAYDGESLDDPPPPTSQVTGTEATTSDYTKLSTSDNNRWQSTTTTNNAHVYHSFYFLVPEEISDIDSITVTWEGYITKAGSKKEDIRIYAYNYNTASYTDLSGKVNGAVSDLTLAYELPDYLSDYINNGEINILVISDKKLNAGKDIRQDIYTDYIKLDVYTIPTISGYQDINVTAVDGDGVSNCTYFFTNSSGVQQPTFIMEEVATYKYYNLSDTTIYADGIYKITANCSDTTSETATDVLRVRVSNTGPTVLLVSPLEGVNFTLNDINFTWNATQGAGNPVCNLTIDDIVVQSNINSPNGQNTTVQENDISDGPHNWKVICTNSANIIGISETRNFTVDTGPPSISLDFPGNNYASSTNNITFLYTPTDTGTLNCSLYINDVFNATNTSVQSNQQSSFDVSNFVPGHYNWTVYCTDQFDFTGNSSTYDFTVDLDNPRIVLTAPEPGDVFLAGLVQFNYTAYDDIDTELSCDIIVNGVTEFSGINSPNATPVIQSKEFTSGVKFWNVTCVDDSGRQNTSETWNFTVNGDPTVNLVSPADQSSLNQTNVSFTYYAEDTDGIANCSLYINSVFNRTESVIDNAQNNDFNVSNMAEGYYNWSVTCYDTTGLDTNSGEFQLTLDRTPPNITLIAPNESAFFVTGDISFNFTVIDNLDASLSCYLLIDGQQRTAENQNFAAQNNTIQVRNETGISGGTHNWQVQCLDDAGFNVSSETRSFDVGGLPTVTLQLPPHNTYSIGNVSFVYYTQDDDGIANCSLYINDVLNQTNSSITNGANNSFTLQNIAEQTLNWSVSCTDNLDLTKNSGNYILIIDNTPPVINLLYPNGTILTDTTVEFNFTIVENTLGSLTCNITVNGTVEDSDFSAANGTNSRTISGLNTGTNFWNVTCVDQASFSAVSLQTYNFTIVLAPDVTLLNPQNDSTDTDGNVTFQFRVDNNDIENCTLYLNGITNKTINSSQIVPFGISEINVSNLQPQILNWTVGCINDKAVAANASNGPWLLHIDFNPPYVTLNEPIDGANISLSQVTFNFTAYDDIDEVLSCNITLDGQINQTNISAQNATPILRTVSGLTVGTH